MNHLLENLERLGERARGDAPPAGQGLADGVLRQIAGTQTADARWPIVLVTAGYAAAACLAMIWMYSAYETITHPLLQFFNTVAMATF